MIRSIESPPPSLKKYWILVPAWMILIFCLSHMTGSSSSDGSQVLVDLLIWLGIDPAIVPLETLSFLVRKSAHFTEYLILGILSLPLFHHYFGKKSTYWLLAWAFCVLYAASDEFHQSQVPGRTAKYTDIIIDAVGAAIGIWWMNSRLHKKQME